MQRAELPQPRVALKQALVAARLPAWKVAVLASLSPTQLSHISTGRRIVSVDEAVRLSTVLRVRVDELFPERLEAGDLP